MLATEYDDNFDETGDRHRENSYANTTNVHSPLPTAKLIQPGRSVYVYANAPPMTSSPTNRDARSISGGATDWPAGRGIDPVRPHDDRFLARIQVRRELGDRRYFEQ